MKKSEMSKLIQEVIYNNKDLINEGKAYLVANVLLEAIENAGMQPPFSGPIKEVNIEDRWGQPTGKSEYRRVMVNEWEPE